MQTAVSFTFVVFVAFDPRLSGDSMGTASGQLGQHGEMEWRSKDRKNAFLVYSLESYRTSNERLSGENPRKKGGKKGRQNKLYGLPPASGSPISPCQNLRITKFQPQRTAVYHLKCYTAVRSEYEVVVRQREKTILFST